MDPAKPFQRMTGRMELALVNQKSEIAGVQNRLEAFLREHGVAARAVHDAQLALEEHLTNIVSYAYGDREEHQIRVAVQLTETELRMEVEDDGRAFDPEQHPTPDLSKPIDERPIGGLGIHMMRKSLTELKYRREDSKNVLVMIKRLSGN